MKKIFALILILILSNVGIVQAERDADFHKKYKLKSVVVFSRHNIRAPTKSNSAVLSTVTPYKWTKWSSNYSELSLRGVECETLMGQYFRQWLESENLIPHNYIPSEGEVRFYANSRQRTLATAKFFSAGMLPVANVEVERKFAVEKNDPVFRPIMTAYNEEIDLMAREAIKSELSKIDFESKCKILNKVIDFKKSELAKTEGFNELSMKNADIVVGFDDEPHASNKQSSATISAADALIMQYYETGTAFGRKLSFEDWRQIASIKDDYQHAYLAAPSVNINLAHLTLQAISDELALTNRKFSFLCGHDSNIEAILGALDVEEYNLPDVIESRVPIGSKIVICKWRGEDGLEYASLDLIYARSDQLRNKTILTLDNPPTIVPLSLKDVQQNSDDLYKFEDVQERFQDAINAYNDLPQAEKVAA